MAERHRLDQSDWDDCILCRFPIDLEDAPRPPSRHQVWPTGTCPCGTRYRRNRVGWVFDPFK